MIFVITGPSGCGKSTLVKHVLEMLDDVEFSVSHTTRTKRNGEVEGKDYYFVSKEEFEQMIRKGKLLEWALVHGQHYGTSKRELEKKSGKDLLLDIDVQGAEQVKDRFKKAVFVFILPPVFKELRRRLEKRGDMNPAAIRKRLDTAKKEIRYYSMFDCLIINDKLEQAVEELKAIILSSRCRLEARQKEILPILRSFTEER